MFYSNLIKVEEKKFLEVRIKIPFLFLYFLLITKMRYIPFIYSHEIHPYIVVVRFLFIV